MQRGDAVIAKPVIGTEPGGEALACRVARERGMNGAKADPAGREQQLAEDKVHCNQPSRSRPIVAVVL